MLIRFIRTTSIVLLYKEVLFLGFQTERFISSVLDQRAYNEEYKALWGVIGNLLLSRSDRGHFVYITTGVIEYR